MENIAVIGSNCAGCYQCLDVCKFNAIDISHDEEGFFYPRINDKKCVGCGMCLKNCPAKLQQKNPKPDKVYAYVGKEYKNSSSGGAFHDLAVYLMKEGYVICAAKFDDSLHLCHDFVEDESQLIKFQRSKYIQSDMSNIYKRIGNVLKEGKKLVFVGTPCQVSAVKNLFKEKHPNQIFLIDFVCHGVPSQEMFDACIKDEEKRIGGQIISFDFRCRLNHLSQSYRYFYKKNGKIKKRVGYHYEFPYYNAFRKYSTLRKSCYQCKYASVERCGDITLADFWGIEKINHKLNSHDGVSMLLINTDLGKNISAMALKLTMSYNLEDARHYNPSLNGPTEYPKKLREKFDDDLKAYGMAEAFNINYREKNIFKKKLKNNIPWWIKRLVKKLTRHY